MCTYSDEINGDGLCKNCRNPIPETKRIDAVFCSPKCGWRYRNLLAREKRIEKIKNLKNDPVEQNFQIIDDLYQRGIVVISQKSMIEIGFNPNAYSNLIDYDEEKGITEFEIKDYMLTLATDKITIKPSI